MVQPSRTEFIVLISSIMMIVAFAIDSMLPALPAIGHSLGVVNENHWSLVITAFTVGFGISQLFVGTLSDRFGRRTLMLGSLVAFALCSIAAALAASFTLLLVARAAQGLGAAGARVIVTSVVRDRFEGRDMAQVMSLAAAIFMAAPIIAPFMVRQCSRSRHGDGFSSYWRLSVWRRSCGWRCGCPKRLNRITEDRLRQRQSAPVLRSSCVIVSPSGIPSATLA